MQLPGSLLWTENASENGAIRETDRGTCQSIMSFFFTGTTYLSCSLPFSGSTDNSSPTTRVQIANKRDVSLQHCQHAARHSFFIIMGHGDIGNTYVCTVPCSLQKKKCPCSNKHLSQINALYAAPRKK